MCMNCDAEEQAEIQNLIAQYEQENEDYVFHEYQKRQNVIGGHGN